MVMRGDKSEVMVGTMQENILRFPLEISQIMKDAAQAAAKAEAEAAAEEAAAAEEENGNTEA